MTNAIKGLVSKRKKRYKEDGFNLDLTYICDNIIAMGYPAKNLEGVYRNHIDDVRNFLNTKHNNNYKIYNLCEEKKYQYDISKFQHCASFPFSDHNPPNIELIQDFCNNVHSWLTTDPKNVAAIHCKAGKGRTGTMICCYLLHSGILGELNTAADALNYYGQKRTTDKKGVTIPSQRRYVEYYSQLLKTQTPYTKVAMQICEIKIYHLPSFRSLSGGAFTFSISSLGQKLYSEQLTDLKRIDSYVSIKLDRCIRLVGDIKVEFSCTQIMKHKTKLFHFWFNTYFVNEITNVDPDGNVIFELHKWEIDDAHKDKQKMYHENFKIETVLQKVPLGGWYDNQSQALQTPSESFCTESSTDSSTEEEGWESGESDDKNTFTNFTTYFSASIKHSNNNNINNNINNNNNNNINNNNKSLVRYRLLSEPEISNILKSTTSTNSLQASQQQNHQPSAVHMPSPTTSIKSADSFVQSPSLPCTNNENDSQNHNNNNLIQA
ncbi:unnamed protein product [Diamesa serratosioi]